MRVISFLYKHWMLLAIMIIGGILRLCGLLQNPISLYSDEVDIGYQVQSLLKTGCDYSGYCMPIQFHSFSDIRTPMPIYFTALLNILGVQLDYAIRLTSAIFGILGVFATYLFVESIASKKIFNIKVKNIGLYSAAVLSVVPWHLTYSRIGFELSTLYFFVVFGLFLFTTYLSKKQNRYLYLSAIFLGLTPLIYSTAKLAIVLIPFTLLTLPGSIYLLKKNRSLSIFLLVTLLPLIIIFVNGGADSRFRYISIFTDPIASTEVNYQRLGDAGPNAVVGTTPSKSTVIFHNKPLWYLNNLTKNAFNLLSTNFLFINGDPNSRHSPTNWGVLYRSLFPVILVGLFFLIRFKQTRLLLFLISFTAISVITSSITRDGGNHASRSFMMLLPMVVISGIGLSYLLKLNKIIFFITVLLLITEAVLFMHNYWSHYRYDTQRQWSAGMKELMTSVKNNQGRTIIISPRYENPLIFYLYYTNFPPNIFQKFSKSNTIYNDTKGKNNLDGSQIGDTNMYIATLVKSKTKEDYAILNSVYYLTRSEIEETDLFWSATKSAIIKLPSGEPLFYEIHN